MNEKPTVSIILKSSKNLKHVRNTISSIQSQTFQNWELIILSQVVNAKLSSEIIPENDTRIKIIFIQESDSSFEWKAVETAQGNFLALIEAGDQWHRKKIERQLEFLATNSEVSVCCTYIKGIASGGMEGFFNKAFDLTDIENWIWKSPVCLNSALMKKEAILKSDAFKWDNSEIFLMNIFLNGVHFGMVPEILTFVNESTQSQVCLVESVESGYWEYARFSKELLHGHLMKSDRQDLLLKNAKGFISHKLFSNLTEIELKRLSEEVFSGGKIPAGSLELEFFKALLEECQYSANQSQKFNSICMQMQIENRKLKDETNLFEYRQLRKLKKFLFSLSPLISKSYKKSLKIFHNIRKFSLIRRLSVFFRDLKSKVKPISVECWPKDAPLVTIVVPCYNYGRFLGEALDSIVRQTLRDLEIIVVDDGSTERNTIDFLDHLRLPNVRVVRQVNQGVSAARNNGIALAKGKYVCCLDADDLLQETYLEKCVFFLETLNLDICYSWVKSFGAQDEVWECGPFIIDDLLRENEVSTAAVFKKECWSKAGGYDTKMSKGYEDWEFWIRLASLGARGYVIPEPLFFYRKHGISLTTSTDLIHEKLHRDLKSNHPGLFEKNDAIKIASIVQNQKPAKTQNGLINLDRMPFKSAIDGRITTLVAVPWFDLGGSTVLLSNIFSEFPKDRYRFISIATNQSTDGSGISYFQSFSDECFDFSSFLNVDDYLNFLEHLLFSRSVEIVFIVGSSELYERIPALKAKFPNLTVIDHLYNKVGHVLNNRKFTDFIDFNIVANEEVRDFLIEKGENTNRIEVIPHGIDAYRFNPGIESFAVARNSKVKAKFTFGFLGRLSQEKRPQDFIALARLLPECDFRICGDGPLKSKLMKDVAGHNGSYQ